MQLMNIFDEIKYHYIEAIGEIPDNTRTARMVEMRGALSNAMAPYCHFDDIARLWKRDRTTIYNAVDKHDAYMMTSREYQQWYAIAVEVVDSKIDDMPPRKVNLEANLRQNSHEQIDAVNKTIRILEDYRARLEKRLRPSKSNPLPEVRKGSVPYDVGRVGDQLVHKVLRDEQLQVSDESGNETELLGARRFAKGEMVRGQSEGVEG